MPIGKNHIWLVIGLAHVAVILLFVQMVGDLTEYTSRATAATHSVVIDDYE